MGGTLPVLTRFFVKRLEQLGTNIGILYALNTFGAVIGTVAAGFFLIEALGVRWTLGVGIAINFGVAAVALALSQKVPETEEVSGQQSDFLADSSRQSTADSHPSDSRQPTAIWYYGQ